MCCFNNSTTAAPLSASSHLIVSFHPAKYSSLLRPAHIDNSECHLQNPLQSFTWATVTVPHKPTANDSKHMETPQHADSPPGCIPFWSGKPMLILYHLQTKSLPTALWELLHHVDSEPLCYLFKGDQCLSGVPMLHKRISKKSNCDCSYLADYNTELFLIPSPKISDFDKLPLCLLNHTKRITMWSHECC